MPQEGTPNFKLPKQTLSQVLAEAWMVNVRTEASRAPAPLLSSGFVDFDLLAPLCGHNDAPLASVSYFVPLKVSHEILRFPDGCFNDRLFRRPRNEWQTVHLSAVWEKTQGSGPGGGAGRICPRRELAHRQS